MKLKDIHRHLGTFWNWSPFYVTVYIQLTRPFLAKSYKTYKNKTGYVINLFPIQFTLTRNTMSRIDTYLFYSRYKEMGFEPPREYYLTTISNIFFPKLTKQYYIKKYPWMSNDY